jgi:hypothetical protein
MKKLLSISLVSLCLLAGCSSWERTTFQTLSASKATIDTAQADYEAHTIPHVQCSYDLINKAKAGQTLAVNAMLTYETAKTTTGATAAQAVVDTDLTQLVPIIASVKTLYTPTGCGA